MFYKNHIRPLLDLLDSEALHIRARGWLHSAESSHLTLRMLEFCANGGPRIQDARLATTIGGLPLDNFLMVGAGWDKVGEAVAALFHIGFAAIVVGSVPEHKQPGNAKPRQFMLSRDVALNRLGFNSPGMHAVDQNLLAYVNSGYPIGISVCKNHWVPDDDVPRAHAAVIQHLYPHATFFEHGISSPNTPGLRKLQGPEYLIDILQKSKSVMMECGGLKPQYIKIDPDMHLSQLDDIVKIAIDNRITGLVVANTTINSGIKAQYGEHWRSEPGGLSGSDPIFRNMSTNMITHIHREVIGELEIIGVGGIDNVETALEKIMAGANALQIVTGLRSGGPGIANIINRGLLEYLEDNGVKSLIELIGVNVK